MSEQPASNPEVHRATVERLVADALPVRRIWPVRRRLTAWLALSGAILGVTSIDRFRPDLAHRLADPAYLGSVVLLLVAAIVTATLAFRAAEPGREARYRESLGAVILVALAIGLALAAPAGSDLTATVSAREAGPCAARELALAALPWVAILLALGRGAPVRSALAGAQAGAAACLAAAFQVRLLCPLDDRLHLLALHLAPIGIASLVSSALCTAWFRRRAAAHSQQVRSIGIADRPS